MREIKEKDTRYRILKAAIGLFAQYGYDGVGIRRIAKEAGVNLSMIGYYFGNKENLYKAILSLYLDEFKMAILNLPPMPEKQFIKAFIANHIKYIKRRGRDVGVLIFREHLSESSRFKTFFEDALKEVRERLIATFDKGIKTGIFKDISPLTLTQLLIGVDVALVFKSGIEDEKKLTELAYDVFMNGVSQK